MRIANCILTFVIACSTAFSSQGEENTQGTPLHLGAAWYPEQWPESRWERDLTLMENARINFVRIGEFAWSALEPSEGHYDMGWLERAVRMAEKHHISVVLGTPSAAPPAWLTSRYPETLRTLGDGRKAQHGNRQQFDWSNAKYRELAGKIAEQMARRFGHDPNVIGWQIDNEYADLSYGPDTKRQFQEWLRTRYGSLDNLNARWTTRYWSQSYTDWSQIPIETSYANPGLLLSWQRFVSDTWRSYQKVQLDKIKKYKDKRQFVTTNMMGFDGSYDHYTVSQDLDLAVWDDYVGTGHLNPITNGAAHDLTRGFLHKNFWVMETQPGFVNWSKNNNALNKGEVRAMAWHAVGHGADAVAFWQWRSALNGQEQYHGTLIGADGTPVPLYDEVAQLGREFEMASSALGNTQPHAEVALLHSYESRWAINWQKHNQAFNALDALMSYYGPLRNIVHSVDIVSPSAPLSQYKLVVAPALNLLTASEAQSLMDYVQNGGHLVLGQRSAMKDEDNALWPERQPGPLAQMLGGRVEQFYALDQNIPLVGEWGKGSSKIWADQLSVKDARTRVLMRYGKSNGWLDDQPAAITRAIGKGRITYIGAWLDDKTMTTAAKWMIKTSAIQPLAIRLPEGVEFSVRSERKAGKAQKTIWIFVNFGKKSASFTLPHPMTDVLIAKAIHRVTLLPYGVAVLMTEATE